MINISYCVYKHTTPNSKVYIGITSKKPEERWKGGAGYSNNKHFASAIQLYGWNNIKHEIIKDGLSKEQACEIEKQLIKEYDSTNRNKGYNVSTGGENSSEGFHHTEEAKEKIGEASKGRKRSACNIRAVRKALAKKVKVYDINRNYIGTYDTVIEAEKATGVNNSNIVATCKGKYEQFKGYIFRYEDDTKPIELTKKHRKPVAAYDLDGKLVSVFKSIKEASRTLNIADTHISDCCLGRYKQSGGFVWKYI